MSDNQSQSQESPVGDLRATLGNNKGLSGIIALVLAGALGLPLGIYAKAEDVEALTVKVSALEMQVRELSEGVGRAAKTGIDLRQRIDDLFPMVRKLTDEDRIEKEIQRRLEDLQKKPTK